MYWNEKTFPDSGFQVTATPGRHFTRRGFKRNQSIWCSFVLQTTTKKIFIGGDSGYDTHLAKIGAEHGTFRFGFARMWPVQQIVEIHSHDAPTNRSGGYRFKGKNIDAGSLGQVCTRVSCFGMSQLNWSPKKLTGC